MPRIVPRTTLRIAHRPARIVAVGLALALAPTALLAQLVSPACAETCPNPITDPSGAAACTARVSTCQTKLGLYNTYMGQLGAGVARTPLTALYRQVLGTHISTAILGAYQFGRADRQPPNNSTTDCSITYYNPSFAAYTERLAAGQLNTDAELGLLLHELAHAEQCVAVGGRDRYAAMWFREMELAALQSGGLDFAEIHALQPMENQARDRAGVLLARIARNRNADGFIVPPQPNLHVASIGTSPNPRLRSCGLRIGIENMGTGPLPASAYAGTSALVRVTSGTETLGELTIADLDPNGVLRSAPPRAVTVTWTPRAPFRFTGTRSITVRVDPNTAVSDANRANNTRLQVVTCTA